MNAPPPSLLEVRIATLMFPPAGLVLLWRAPLGWGRKLFGTLGIALYSLPYAALVILVLLKTTPLEVEWRGGFPPVLTFHKTKPDYDAVVTHRVGQSGHLTTPRLQSANAPPPYWTDFRGPRRDGRYAETPINTDWATKPPRLLWKQPIGGGYASFVIAQGLAFTIEQRRDREAITAYDVNTGREVWAHSYPAYFNEDMGGEGPRATPTYADGRLYALGATGEFHCLDAATGRVLWRKNILTENHADNLTWAQSASPLVVDNKVIAQPGGPAGGSVVAYDKLTGTLVWKALNAPSAYSSAMVVTLAGDRQILIAVLDRVAGLRVEDGSLLWDFPWTVQMNNRNIAQPVLLGPNRFLLSAGYGTGCVAVEVTRTENGFAARQLWRNKNLKNKFNSSVLHDGYIYGLDEGVLTCLDAATGVRRWKDGRYGYGQLLLASGHLVTMCGEGDLALVKAAPERLLEVARLPALKGKTWNHPALAQGRLLVRNAVEMACFDLSAP